MMNFFPKLEWMAQMMQLIHDHQIDKAEKDNVVMYRVKNIIRIDIKEGKEDVQDNI